MPTLDDGTRVEQHDFGSTRDTKVLSMDDAVDGNVFRRVRGVNSLNKVTGASVEHDTLTADHIQVGSLTADLIDVDELSALTADLGEVVAGIARDADNNFRIDFDDGVISIRDEQDPQELRLRIGALGAGVEDYGIEVWGPDGTLILGADGLGVAVVGENNLDNDCVSSDKVQDVAIQTVHLDAFAVTASKIGTLDGNGLQIDLHATGSDPVLLHDNFRLDADGDATFGGTLQADNIEFRTPLDALAGHIEIGVITEGAFFDTGIALGDRLGNNQLIVGPGEVFIANDLHVDGDLTVDGSTPDDPVSELSDLDDVDTTGVSGDDVLTFDGVEWGPAAIPPQSTSGATEPDITIEDNGGATHEFSFEDGLLKTYTLTPV